MHPSNDQWKEAILAAALCPTDPWLPELTELLVDSGWHALSQEMGISTATYSTTNVMRRASVVPSVGALMPIPIGSGKFPGSIEFLPDDVQERFGSKDYRFQNACEVADAGLTETLALALELIALVPSLQASSSQLIRSVHLLQSSADNCDISFSDPAVPFSIFVSIPRKDSRTASLRLAEAIIHEAMHLQLSLLERITPVAFGDTAKYYSPWKRSNRKASGVLHALYVFTVIDAWLKRLPSSADSYAQVRRSEIAEQIAEIEPFRRADLTEVGAALRLYLFSQH